MSPSTPRPMEANSQSMTPTVGLSSIIPTKIAPVQQSPRTMAFSFISEVVFDSLVEGSCLGSREDQWKELQSSF
jgi:hypothetical protein